MNNGDRKYKSCRQKRLKSYETCHNISKKICLSKYVQYTSIYTVSILNWLHIFGHKEELSCFEKETFGCDPNSQHAWCNISPHRTIILTMFRIQNILLGIRIFESDKSESRPVFDPTLVIFFNKLGNRTSQRCATNPDARRASPTSLTFKSAEFMYRNFIKGDKKIRCWLSEHTYQVRCHGIDFKKLAYWCLMQYLFVQL